MNIFDVGGWELGFIIVLAIILVGPKHMAETGTTIGRWLNKFVKSDVWIALKEVWNAVAHAPTQMMRDANLEDLRKELNLGVDDPLTPRKLNAAAPLHPNSTAAPSVDNSILPPGRSQIFADTPPEVPSEESSTQKPAPKVKKAAKKKSPPKAKSSSLKKSKANSVPKKSTAKKRSNA